MVKEAGFQLIESRFRLQHTACEFGCSEWHTGSFQSPFLCRTTCAVACPSPATLGNPVPRCPKMSQDVPRYPKYTTGPLESLDLTRPSRRFLDLNCRFRTALRPLNMLANAGAAQGSKLVKIPGQSI